MYTVDAVQSNAFKKCPCEQLVAANVIRKLVTIGHFELVMKTTTVPVIFVTAI